MQEIKLTTLPVIEHDLMTVGRMVDERLQTLNINNLVATDDTIQTLKSLRADLNKEFKDFEEQRKVVKDLVMKPYNEMDGIYKQMITDKYKQATETLKDKIGEFENKIKEDKTAEIKKYFTELCDAKNATFLKWENTKIEVNLSTSTKKYKEEISEFVERVVSDISLIELQQFSAEMLVEYKKDLNLSRSIREVTERKEAEHSEIERQQQAEYERRSNMLIYECNMIRREFVKAYVNIIEEAIYVPFDFLKTASREEFNARVSEIKIIIASQNKKEEAPTEKLEAPKEVTAPTKVAETKPELIKITFDVEGTYNQLKELNSYLKQSGLTYKQL